VISSTTRQQLLVCVCLCTGLSAACSSPPSSAPPPASPPLWGEMKPVVSVKELMRDMLDPVADNIFDAVSVVITKQGTVEKTPKTEEDWEKIRIGAVTLAEGVYLLKIPRPFAPPEEPVSPGVATGEELTPAQMKAKLEADPVLWNAKIEALRNVGLEVMDIVKRRDVNELWDASDNLDQACEGCHVAYWYPGEGELLKKLDKQLQELSGKLPRPGRSGR
jgi:hypothetical protein